MLLLEQTQGEFTMAETQNIAPTFQQITAGNINEAGDVALQFRAKDKQLYKIELANAITGATVLAIIGQLDKHTPAALDPDKRKSDPIKTDPYPNIFPSGEEILEQESNVALVEAGWGDFIAGYSTTDTDNISSGVETNKVGISFGWAPMSGLAIIYKYEASETKIDDFESGDPLIGTIKSKEESTAHWISLVYQF